MRIININNVWEDILERESEDEKSKSKESNNICKETDRIFEFRIDKIFEAQQKLFWNIIALKVGGKFAGTSVGQTEWWRRREQGYSMRTWEGEREREGGKESESFYRLLTHSWEKGGVREKMMRKAKSEVNTGKAILSLEEETAHL